MGGELKGRCIPRGNSLFIARPMTTAN